MPNPGDVVIVYFAGAEGSKTRPAVILSTPMYHNYRPDVILGLLTSNVSRATTPTDYILQDWVTAGLVRPTAFRSYLLTLRNSEVPAPIGRLSEQDWQEVKARMLIALAL